MKNIIEYLKTHGLVKREKGNTEEKDSVIYKELTWKELQKKCRPDLIANFVIRKQHEYNLSQQETNHLITIINSYIQFGKLSDGDFVINNFAIQTIRGLAFDTAARIWSFEHYLKINTINRRVPRRILHITELSKYSLVSSMSSNTGGDITTDN